MTAPDGNVLFIVADQLRADVLNGPLAACVPTPNLDRLAAEGVSFDNHFTVAVPCGPARASLLTGLYAMNHRSIRNGTPLAAHHDNLALALRRAGREPLLFGYTDATPDPRVLPERDPALASYEGLLPGFRELTEMRFETSLEWLAHLGARGYDLPRPLPERLAEIYVPQTPEGREPRASDPAIYRAEDSDTAYLTDRTLALLEARRDAPWVAHVTYIRPHPPFVAPAPWNKLVSSADVAAPSFANPDAPFVDAWFSEPTAKGLWAGFDGDCAGMTEAEAAEIRAVYLGLVAELDHHVGRLLDWLDDTGQADRTLVVFVADHGEMLGEHRMWGKISVFDGAFHVPLTIRDPHRRASAGRRVSAITESIDLAPTILDWLGEAPPPAWDGTPLTPWLDGAAPASRDAAMMELDLAEPNAPTRFQRTLGLTPADASITILREKDWKYVHMPGGLPPMLFDLARDPHETRDLAGDPAHAGERLRLAEALLARRILRNDRSMTHMAVGVG